MGVYMILMKSDRDETLAWPFTKRYSLILVDLQDDLDQRQNIQVTIGPRAEEEFQRPRWRENRGGGKVRFVKHSTLQIRQYIKDDTAYIKLVIDP